jgi:hypothetical protein
MGNDMKKIKLDIVGLILQPNTVGRVCFGFGRS